MSRYLGARWRGPVPNMASGGMASHRLFVLHIEEGTEAGTDAWQHNPVAQVSSHFGNPKSASAPLDQFVDTDDRAWAEAAYNNVAISVEHEGNTGDSLTPAQLERDAQLLAWCHTNHGTKLQVTNDPNGDGVIGHGLLGVAGGDHPDCPGAPILAQRQAIVDRAKAILNPVQAPTIPKEPEMILLTGFNQSAVAALSGNLLWAVQDGAAVNAYKAAGVQVATIDATEYAAITGAVAASKSAISLTDAQVAALGAAIAAGVKLPTTLTLTGTETVTETGTLG